MKYSSKHLVDWISAHPALNITRIEQDLNIPRLTIAHAIAERRLIPEKHVSNIEVYLSNYGYVEFDSE